MDVPHSQVFFPSGFQELFSSWNRFPDSVLCAGGTGLLREQGGKVPALPKNIISLEKLEDLGKISRTERYLEIGAMVKLSQIMHLGKIVPEALTRCLGLIGGPQIRNLATIGGNLCNPARRLDCSVPMIALDARFELRNAQSSRWISAARFLSGLGPPAMERQELLTRIRVPLEPWAFTSYCKFKTPGSGEPGGAILFIMQNQKNTLTNIQVVYSGLTVLREKNSETMLAGKRLPLERKDAKAFIDKWNAYLVSMKGAEQFIFPKEAGIPNDNLRWAQIMNFIESAVLSICA